MTRFRFVPRRAALGVVAGIIAIPWIAACAAGPADPGRSPAASVPGVAGTTPAAKAAASVGAPSPSTAPPSAAAPSLEPSASAAPDALAGTWTTGMVTCDQWNAAIAKVYTREQVRKYDDDPNTKQCPSTFLVRFRGGHMLIFVDDELGWDGPYRITGPDTFESGDTCAYCWSYGFHRTGGTLAVDLVHDGDPVDPLLDGIVQTGIFESVPFTLVP